jgi:ectoine hydroxylase-related dioxygenase (phytanoyl-CoA dioxygenase family)
VRARQPRCRRLTRGTPGSELHDALAALAAAGGFEALLSAHCGGRCTLSESGVSVTRRGGCGMEWHADGTRGEATVLLALQDVPPEAGALGIVPASHLRYSARKASATQPGGEAAAPAHASEACACGGDGDEDQVAAVMAQCAPPLWYAYRRGMPALLDARTLHAAADNVSGALRAVVWLIYTQEEADEGAGSEADADEADAAGRALAALAVGDR